MEEIRYRLQELDLSQFVMRTENYHIGEDINAETNMSFAYNKDQYIVRSSVYISMSQNDKKFLEMQMDVYTELEKSSVDKIMTTEGVQLPRELQCQFASFGYGALRGVMLIKTVNTPLSKIILPPLILQDIIANDITISLN